MPMYSFEGRSPRVDPTAFVAPTAVLIGDVTVEADVAAMVKRTVAGRRFEAVASALCGSRFTIVETHYGGGALDIDDDREIGVLLNHSAK